MTDIPPTAQRHRKAKGLAEQGISLPDQSASMPLSQTPPPPRRHISAVKAVIAMLIGLAVAALLSSESLVGLAERQPVGTGRDVALSAARNLHRASSFLSLDRPASALRSALGKDETTYDVAALIASGQGQAEPDTNQDGTRIASNTATQPNTANPDTADPNTPANPDIANPNTPSTPNTPANPDTANPDTANPDTPSTPDITNPNTPNTPADPSTPPPDNPAQPQTTQPATPTQNPPASFAPPRDLSSRPITEDDPLKLWVGGDSLSLSLTVGFGRVTSPTLVDFTRDTQLSSGLTRKDFLDWPQRLARLLIEDRPDVLVVMFGGNDYQDVIFNGQLLERPSQPWLDFYRSRVKEAMDLLNQPGLQVIWVGQPVMRNDFYSTGMAHLNEIYRSEAATRSSIAYFDTWSLFADPQGNYTETIDGTLMRESDGIHLTTAGGIRLAQAIWQQVAPNWRLN